MLLPVTVPRALPAGTTELSATGPPGGGQLDALLLTPLVSTVVTRGGGSGVVLLSSVAGAARRLTITVPGSGRTVASAYDDHGRPRGVVTGSGPVTVEVPAGGFVVAVR
jgi:hypothetical protein